MEALALAISLAIMQQIIGINTVLLRAILFKEHAGIGSPSAVGANVLIWLVNFAFTLLAMGIVDPFASPTPARRFVGHHGPCLAGLSWGAVLVTTVIPGTVMKLLTTSVMVVPH